MIFMQKFATICKLIVKKMYIFNILYMLLSDRYETMVDCLLCTLPFVSGERVIFYQFLNKRVSTQTWCCLSWRGATFDEAYYNYY